MCAYSVFNTFPVYPLSAKPLILLAFCRYRYHTSLFDRPAWNELVAGVKAEEITTVIVKDLSRVGRDHLQVGFFTDILFREKEVHFIAIGNGIDSNDQQSSEFAPFLNIMNEWYVRDTSKKIKSVLKARGMSGSAHTSNCACYGYKKDPENPDKWVIDEEAASVVREIFQMCVDGKGPYEIARCLAEKKLSGHLITLPKEVWEIISLIAIIVIPILGEGTPLPQYWKDLNILAAP